MTRIVNFVTIMKSRIYVPLGGLGMWLCDDITQTHDAIAHTTETWGSTYIPKLHI